MNQEKILPKLKKDIRSLLISSKLGVEPEQLRRDYVALVGEPLPLRPLGLTNVMDMVVAMPDVVSVHFREDGSVYLKAVGVESTQNIEMLVAKQRTSKADVQRLKRGHLHGGCHRPPRVLLPRRGLAPPAVPAQLRAQLWKLLSQGPVRLSDLEASFLRCFGHPLCVQNFGFYSTQEMLRTAADLVVIHQDKLGSVVSLRMMPRPPFMKIGPWNFLPGGSRDTKWTRPDPGRAVPPAVPAGPLSSSETVAPAPARAQPETHATTHAEGQRFEKHVQKLEKEFYHQIVENGVAGTISQELKEKLRKVVSQAGGRLCVHDLPAEYKRLYGEDLLLLPSGFVSVTELLDAMSDTFHLEAAESGAGAAWMVSAVQDRGAPQTDSEEAEGPEVQQPSSGYYLSCGDSPWESNQDDATVTFAHRNHVQEPSVPTQHMFSLVCRTSAVPPDALQGQRLKKPSRLGEGEVQVLVEHVESPGCFYVSVCDSREARATEDMMIQMRRCYRCPEVSERYRLPERFVRRGQVCCLCPEGVWFYRVVIHRILSPTHVEVYFVDFGNTIAAPRNRLKFLKSCYSDLPAQAIPSALPGIKPAQGGWTPEATACFRKLCCAHPLVGASAGYTGDVLLLYLCDARTGNQIDFHRLLLREGHGIACSHSVSQELCARAIPVSMYLGEGALDIPEMEEEPSTPPDPVSLSAKVEAEEDEVGLPGLELIEDGERGCHIQGEDSSSSWAPQDATDGHADPNAHPTAPPAAADPPAAPPDLGRCPLDLKAAPAPTASLCCPPQEEQGLPTVAGPCVVQTLPFWRSPGVLLNRRKTGFSFPVFGAR